MQEMASARPRSMHAGQETPGASTPAGREAKLATLYARWDQFAAEYEAARRAGDQETMTNLRGLLLLIKKEIVRLHGQPPEFPYPDDAHVADL
jgi:hypothetical protein